MSDSARTVAAIAIGEAYMRHARLLSGPVPPSVEFRGSVRDLMAARRAALIAGVGRDDAPPIEGETNG